MSEKEYEQYDSEYATYHHEHCSPRVWSHPDADLCGCRGSGWWLSQADCFYPCSYHKGPHPEYEDEETLSAQDRTLKAMAEQADKELSYSCCRSEEEAA